jgi:CpeT protein
MALPPSLGLFGLALLAALPLRAQPAPASREIDELVAWLSGTFDSTEQADLDQDTQAVRMVTVAVPKSLLSFGAPVLYREQAAVDRPDRPYLQRFMRVEQDPGGSILVRVFELKDPIAAAGKWREASDLGLFGKNDVRERDGCLVTLRPAGDRFEGGTSGKRCVSSLRGAAYATSEVRIWRDRLETWDRGYDADGKQVWGPLKGPSRFVKRSAGIPSDALPGAGRPPAVPVVAPPAAVAARAAPVPPPAAMVHEVDPPEADSRGEASLFGIGQRTVFSGDVLRANPAATTVRVAGEGAAYRGVRLAALLDAHGVSSEGAAARHALASAVLVATGADDSVSAFSAEELFLSKDSFFLVFERDGKPLGTDGPLMLLDLESPTRNVKRLRSLEWRSLAVSPPGGKE